MEYNPREIEPKWRTWWEANKVYQVSNKSPKPKYYILDMFPYPSGAGLHVGHPLGYIASDIYSRYKRLKGFNVLHPMGYDAFGLPAEQYALENGIHPAVSTETNIARYRKQMDLIGLSFDWSREVRTCDPGYYRWTQWIFLQLFEHYYDTAADKAMPIKDLVKAFAKNGNAGVTAATSQERVFTAKEWKSMTAKQRDEVLMNYRLAFRKTSYVNWCEALGTVLANDEVVNGVSERGGHPVEIKPMLQWSLRITAYAERLLHGLDAIDFPESLKVAQRNWIGRSEGAQVFFEIEGHAEPLEIYTTRPDTIFGATFMVLAPEHDLVATITTAEQRAEIDNYLNWVKSRTERDRMQEKVVSGAFTGAYAVNPFNQARIPIYISEYVLKGYGTGAIMAVPADDERDERFAQKFGLPVVHIVDKSMYPGATIEDKIGKMINSDFLDGMDVLEAIRAITDRLVEMGIGKKRINYKLRDANFSRQRYWGEPFPIMYDADGVAHAMPIKDLPLELPVTDDFKPGGGKGPLAKLTDWVHLPDGMVRDTDTMPGFAGSSWYFLRYMDPGNNKRFVSESAVDYWQDVDFYIGGAEHAVGHLMYSRMWHKFLYDKGLVPTQEPYKKLVNQGMIQGRSNFVYRATERFFEEFLWVKVLKPLFGEENPIKVQFDGSFERENQYDFGFEKNDLVIEVTSVKQKERIARIQQLAEQNGKRLLVLFNEALISQINNPERIAAVIHHALETPLRLIMGEENTTYERLFVSANLLHKYSEEACTKHHVDVNIVDGDLLQLEKTAGRMQFEKSNFKVDAEGKYYCTAEVEKMSKSKYNVVNPDDMVAEYGADCFRMFEMFLGPIEQSKPWDTKGITGVSTFLRQFWSLYFDAKGNFAPATDAPSAEELKVLHTCIKKVTEDLERFSMNTCVSHFMTCKNELRRLNCSKRAILEPLAILIAPFAPHTAEELWHRLGHKTSVCDAVYPVYNEEYLKSDTIVYPVQINGKHRGNIEVAVSATNAEIETAVMALDFVQKNLNGGAVKKFIVVPGRIVNIVA